MPTDPFTAPGEWYRGNLHTHTTESDGRMTPREMVAWHLDQGYDFLSLTEHRIRLDPAPYVQDGLLLIPGIELHGHDPRSGLYHVVGVGVDDTVGYQPGLGLQATIDSIRAANGLAVMAHPYWSGQTSAGLAQAKGALGLEVFNGVCEKEIGKGLAAVHWDEMLAAGARVWGLAVDDAHGHPPDGDLGWGWVMVKAQELSQEAILTSLVHGAFYATSGPQIHDLALADGVATVRCSPVQHIHFVCDGALGGAAHAWDGPPLTETRFSLRNRGETYLRVECIDGEGRRAWSQPIFLA